MRFIQKTACILLLVSTHPSTPAQSPPATKPVTEQTSVERTRPENPILQKVTSVLERVLEAQKTFADENLRVMIRAHIADLLWSYDQPRARRIFEDALQGAERLADQDPPAARLGIAFLPVRTQVIRLILPLDPDWATKLIESAGELATDPRSRNIRRNRERTNLQLQLGSFFAQRDPQRALLAAKPLAESGDSNGLLTLLSFIRFKEVKGADELFLLVLAKTRLSNPTLEDIRRFGPYVFQFFGEGVLRFSTDGSKRDPFAAGNSGPGIVEQFLEFAYEVATRRLDAAVTGANGARLDARSPHDIAVPKVLASYFDRFLPDKAPAFRARLQEALQRVPPEERQYLALTEPGTVESLLLRADAVTDTRLKDTLIQRAVFQASGDFQKATAIIDRLSSEAVRTTARYTLRQSEDQLHSDEAWSALNKGEYDRAEALAAEISDWRSDDLLVRGLIGQLSHKDKMRATRILSEYMQRAAAIVEPHDRALRLMQLAGAGVNIDSNRAFEDMKRAIAEFNQAGFVPELEKYSDNETSGGPGSPKVNIGLSGLLGNWNLYWLGATDMDRAMSLTREFQLKEAAALMQLNVCRGALRAVPASAR